MSGYPYGYPYQGQPPPPPPPPPSQQQYSSYQPFGAYSPANGFGTTPPQPQQQHHQHYAPPTNGYYANAQSAYDYNASTIPGLGTPSSGPSPFPMPYNGTWNQGGYGNNAPQVQSHAYAPIAPPSSTPTTYPYPQEQAPVPQIPLPATPVPTGHSKRQNEIAPGSQPKARTAEQPKLQDGNAEVQEEGEIDDGYFDDLYDDASKAPSVTNETAATTAKASKDMVEDTLDQEPNFYDTEVEDVPSTQKLLDTISVVKTQDSSKLQGQADRDRSRSYSPHLTPIETRGGSSTQGNVGAGTNESRGGTVVSTVPASMSSNQGGGSPGENGAEARLPIAAVTGSIPPITPSTSFSSVSEASNEAKKAILRLLPHGVKFQTYLDEGFDAELVKDLFSQLNLPTESASPAQLEKRTTTQEKGTQPSGNQPSPQTQTDTLAKKQEERKDKIARLMAEKKAKLAAANSSAGAAAESSSGEKSASGVTISPAKPPITRAEKDRLLQQKVEALRNKARETKKLAQKSASTQKSKPDDAVQKPAPPQVSTTTSQSPAAPQSTSGTPLSSASQSAAPSPGVSTMPSMPRASQINQRKRPVAADFMDYPPLPAKRPFLANRQNSSFVISISDDEDDDEDDDVEMEVESATEDSPASAPQTLNLTRRGPAIRDFPPLSNTKNTRQVQSPVSGLSVSGPKNTNADLETKEKAIMEMQKRIKELEAKKEAKARSGNVTPRSPSAGGIVLPEQAVQTPIRRVVSKSDTDDKTTPSAQLLQEAEAARAPITKFAIASPHTGDERPARVSGANLSGKSAKALEKAERLRRMQEEMQRLQAEIDLEDDDVEVEEQRMSEEAEASVQTGGTQASQGLIVSTGHESDTGALVKRVESSSATTPEEGRTTSVQIFPEAQLVQIDSSPDPSDYGIDTAALSHATTLTDQLATQTCTASDARKLPDASGSTDPLQPREKPAVADLGESEGYQLPELKDDGRVGENTPMFSPAPAEVAQSATQQRGQVTVASKEAVNDTLPIRHVSFAPYESPLRYYHAYRFHPNYNNDIHDGLKSLTYSNRIDPNKEMCPDEWEGNDCPRGEACQFQHLQSIVAPDSEIILELGSSDEFTGEQKREFNNGLREVVASFQKSKVRDFRTIAQAIVDFRHRFIGDPSKVLRLEGINI